MLRRIFGSKRNAVTGEWRKVQNEELNDLYSSSNIVRVKKSGMKWEGHVASMKERGIYRVLVGKPKEMRPPERPRRIREDNIKTDLQDVGRGHGLARSGPGKGQVSGSCECGNEPSGSIKCGEFFD